MNLEEIYIAKKAIEKKFNSLADNAELKEYEKLNDELKELTEKEKILLKKEELRKVINQQNEDVCLNKGMQNINIMPSYESKDKDYKAELGMKLKKGESINVKTKGLHTKQTILTTNSGVVIPDYVSDTINPSLQTGNFLVDQVSTLHNQE